MLKTIFSLLISIAAISPAFAQIQEEHKCSQKSKFYQLDKSASMSQLINIDKYDVNFYKLDLHLENNSVFVKGNVTIQATVSSLSLDTFVCDLHQNMIVDSIYFNNQKVSFSHGSNLIRIPQASALNTGSKMEIVFYYSGTAPTSGASAIGQGLSTNTSQTWGNSCTWSLSQPYSAYEWFPVKQELQDKADSVEVWITTDNKNKAGSNGVLKNVTSLPNNLVRYEWKSTYPIAYYLISVAVAEYIDYTFYAHPTGFSDSIKVVNYIYNNPNTLPQFQGEIDKTADMLNVFSEKFGLYPFHKEKYGHCMAPFSGGMEHQTMTSQGFFFTDLTSHELAHQWFGDDLTCASWKDIAMNEGFASYLEYVFIEEEEAHRKLSWLNSTYNSALRPYGSVYVDDTANVSRIFSSSLTYNKGAYLLHMLRYEINDDAAFFAGLKSYRIKHRGGNVTGEDFKDEMESVTGMDFTDFFNQWYYGQGYPVFAVEYSSHAGKTYLKIDQDATFPSITSLFKTHVDVLLPFSDRPDTTVRLYVSKASELFTIENLSGNLAAPIVDPELWILNDVDTVVQGPIPGFAKVAEGKKVSVFPNPTKDEVNINFGKTVNDVEINVYSVKGDLMYRKSKISGDSYTFRLNRKPGSYLLKMTFSDGTYKEFKLLKE